MPPRSEQSPAGDTSVLSDPYTYMIPVHVINLPTGDGSRRRWDAVKDTFPKAGLRPLRCVAVDGRKWRELVPEKRFPVFRKRFTQPKYGGDEPMSAVPGDIGCFLSHARLWDRIAKEGCEVAVVAEDDAVPLQGIANKLVAAIAGLVTAEWSGVCVNTGQLYLLNFLQVYINSTNFHPF